MFELMLFSLLGCGGSAEPAVLREQRCLQNEMDACFEIGYQALHRPRPDIGTARREFAKGCQMVHHPQSCFELGKMVRDARGGPRDLKRAADLFKIACEDGEIQEACVNLGMAQFDGRGTKMNAEKAVEHFRGACEHEEDPQPEGCAALGIAYLEGKGMEEADEEMGESLLRKSCKDDYPAACVLVGTVSQEKKSRNKAEKEENMGTALDFYDRACKIEARFGCYEFAELHEGGDPAEASDKKAAEYFQKTCNIDPTRGCFEAAQLMESGRVAAREGEIESLYNIACEHGQTAACAKRSLERE